MSEEKNIPQEEGKSEQQKNEKVNEYFPEDNHAPKPRSK